MGLLARLPVSLVALLCASAALATKPCESLFRAGSYGITSGWVLMRTVVAELGSSRDLEVRATTKCPDSYTSKNGLNFTTYCEHNNPFNGS